MLDWSPGRIIGPGLRLSRIMVLHIPLVQPFVILYQFCPIMSVSCPVLGY